MYPRNAASPPAIDLGQILLLSDGTIQTTGVSVRVRIGTGAWGAGAGSLDCDAISGIWTYTPTQAETNDLFFLVAAYKSGCTAQSRCVITSASDTTGYAGLDWSKVRAPTTTLNLSGTSIKTATDVETDTADIQGRLPAALASGRMDASVGAYQTGLAPPTANQNAAATWGAMLVDYVSSGSFGATVGAISSKTTNLPSDPADASDIAAAFVAVNAKLDAIDDYVDSEVSAIKTVTDKINGMLVLNGSLYEYTSAALANSPSGSVYVYPMSMEQEPRNTHATITVYTEETGSQYFFAYDSAGAALSLTGKTLEFRVADTKSKQRLYTAKTSDGTLTISLGNKVTFTKSTKFTRFANTDVTYSLRDMDAGGEVLLDGQIELMWAP